MPFCRPFTSLKVAAPCPPEPARTYIYVFCGCGCVYVQMIKLGLVVERLQQPCTSTTYTRKRGGRFQARTHLRLVEEGKFGVDVP